MRWVHFLTALAYGTYLTYAGLLFIVVPWTDLWGVLITRLPPVSGGALGAPAIRGAISAFGALHLVVAALEIRSLFGGTKSAGSQRS